MRELRLKYIIDLVSNVGAKATADAKTLQQAQEVMNRAITGTNDKFLDYNKLALLAGKNTSTMQEIITGATNKFAALDRALAHVGNNTSIERQVGYLQRLGQAVDAAHARAQKLRTSLAQGIENAPAAFAYGAGGYYGARTVMAPPLRAYSSLESATQDLRIAMTDAKGQVSKDFDKISAEAVKLGNQLPGTTKDFMLAARALVTQGVPTSVAANGGLRASSYVGALLDIDQARSAEVIAKLREAHGLKDDELVPMADLVQRAFFGFGIKPQDYLETAKYAAPTFSTMGITGLAKTRETLAIQGMAANVGLENSSFGTNYAQMLTRLSQIEPRLAKKSKEAKEIKAMLGEHGISMSFYGEQGQFLGNKNMLEQLAKLRGLNPLEQTRTIHTLFGTEGGRPAQIMVQKGMEAYEAALKTIDNQANLDTRITMRMETFAAKLEALSGTITNVMAKIGSQMGEGLKAPMDKANEVIGGPVGAFFDAHPTAGTVGLLGAGGIGAWLTARFGAGALKMLLGRGAVAAGAQGVAAAAGAAGGAGLLGAIGIGAGVAGAGGFAGWQGYRLADALGQLYGATHRDGVTLNADSRARLQLMADSDSNAAARAMGLPLGLGGLPGGMDLLTLTAPGMSPTAMMAGRATELKVGEGRLAIDVHVTDDRATATATVTKPLSLVRIDGGNTNPGGLPR